MTDFLITMMTLYPWFTWLLVVFFAVTVAFWLLLGIAGVKSVLDWSEMKREDRRILADILARAHSDPLDCDHDVIRWTCTRCNAPDWDGPPDDWSPAAEWGEEPGRAMASLAEVLARASELGYLDDADLRRCDNPDCGLAGVLHNGPCDLPVSHRDGAAMPPQPVRDYLHPAIMDDLEAAGFSEHETTDGAVESMFTRAQAREVQAMITDGVIPGGQEK